MTDDSRERASRDSVTATLQALSLPDNRTGLEGTSKAHLDFLLLSLETLSDEGSEVMLAAAQSLGLGDTIGDRVTLWRLRNANPLRNSSGGRKKVDVDEVRALVMVVCYLARAQHSHIRTVVERLEDCFSNEVSPLKEPLIADYLDAFHTAYRERMVDGDRKSNKDISEQALSLLVELLYYGSRFGPMRLWTSLVTRPEMVLPDLPAESDIPTENDIPTETGATDTSSSAGTPIGEIPSEEPVENSAPSAIDA
ncbi:MAG: DUF3038 domain-containing protein [Cyanobacteria bacterium P01_A01_bin.3]